MSYTPTTWHGGDVLSAEAMNKIENGIANAGSGALEVRVENDSVANIEILDKTWQEIWDAYPNVYLYSELSGTSKNTISSIFFDLGYGLSINGDIFFASSSDSYPYRELGSQSTPVV